MSGSTTPPAHSTRRLILTLGGAAAFVGAVRWLPGLIPQRLDYAEMPGLPGFRTLAAGDVSRGGFDPFVGLSGDAPQPDPFRDAAQTAVQANPCAALFRAQPDSGQVPVASFSDYYCPYCRTQTRRLSDNADAMGLSITWHEWPLFGATSDLAARAALAAGLQGAYLPFHDRLMRTSFRPTPAYLAQVARETGLDAARLEADMASPVVSRRIAETGALALRFGFAGTPAMVIGRTVVQGEVSTAVLRQLTEAERDNGWRAACGA